MTLEHVEVWMQWRVQPSTVEFNPTRGDSVEELTKRIRESTSDLTKKEFPYFRWTALEGETPIGTGVLSQVSWEMGYGEIGYMLGETHHGRGLGSALVRAMVDKILAESSLRRIIAFTAEDNVASWKILEKLGFVREGLMREHYLIRGKPRNEFAYGLLRHEWRC